MENDITKGGKVIVFQLQDEEYALSVEQVGAIEKMQTITRVPHSSKFVKGVINLRGVVTPIIDLRLRFGMEETAVSESTRIIIVTLPDMEVGLIVDAANDIIDIPAEMIEQPPAAIGSIDIDYIEGVTKHNDRLIVLLNLQKVLKMEANESLIFMED
ncbi:chemotaxis protein CheW [Oceanobacillus sp. 143]|uniref:Chemotaxis protein CheW n=1 Tax=Oceanobacillus zhaokaii TaxID=2052660 RepID=A0A345PGH2_9BACI|nr:chemotaxis protein CheW [Oceanobacillus zhaokaii]AXI09102.1 chemotaxis protein CheW [Oceanobacillus zhaokaii]QGS68662.1 chemotaxis protein CheW [Oceanobacillus sp. 143]